MDFGSVDCCCNKIDDWCDCDDASSCVMLFLVGLLLVDVVFLNVSVMVLCVLLMHMKDNI